MCALGPVAAAHSHSQAYYLAPAFQPGFCQGSGYDMGYKWVGRDYNVRARHEGRSQCVRPNVEEVGYSGKLVVIQCGESGQWGMGIPVERRRDSPDTAPAGPQLGLLLVGVFVEAIRRVCYNGVDGVFRLSGNPGEAIVVVKYRLLINKRGFPVFQILEILLPWVSRISSHPV